MGLKILLCNQDWFAKELTARGHTVVTVGPPGRGFDIEYRWPGVQLSFVLEQLPRGFQPDRLVYLDDSGPAWITEIERLTIPTLFYSIDAHHHHGWHKWFATAFDRVLVGQRDYLKEFQTLVPGASWFPLWCTDPLKPEQERPIDVSFRGNFDPRLNPARIEFFARLRELVPVDATNGDYRDIYTKSKIVINQAVKADFNFRVVEALASGALLITPYVDNGMLELFGDGEDLVTYQPNDPADAAKKIRYYLDHTEERERIAANGYRKLTTLHTAKKRAEEIEGMLLTLQPTSRQHSLLGSAMTFLYASDVSRKNGDLYGERYLRIAADYLARSMEQEQTIESVQEETTLLIKSYYTQRGLTVDAMDFLSRVRTAKPENMVYTTMWVDAVRQAEQASNESSSPRP